MAVVLTGCTADENVSVSNDKTAARELTGIRAEIVGGANSATRAGTVTTLVDYVGRQTFKAGEETTFTKICRTESAFTEFTYKDIIFKTGDGSGWTRKLKADGSPEDGGKDRVYWTDAVSPHTFIAYNIPSGEGVNYDWKKYNFTQDATEKTYYIGSLGNPTDGGNIIDYSLTEDEQTANTETVAGKTVYRNPKLEAEDLLLSYDENMQVETGGNVALVKFYHALSSVRVIVNISGFSSTASDHAAVVSNMKLLHQPTMYVWMQANAGAQALRASREGQSFTDQQMVNTAWKNGGNNVPAYGQRKDLKLWIPKPEGSGNAQSKTFTFYGITTPQTSEYISTLDEHSQNRKVELKFDVTYPNPLKPSENVTKTYTASLSEVYFEPNYNTTINISLNHRNEQMTVGAEYENWQYVSTPDVGELKKNSTFLQDTNHDGTDGSIAHPNVTIVGDAKADMDDATWLYELDDKIYDVYGHLGTENDPYQISTAYQLLSFAYEVKNGKNFEGKYIRLDADLTLQKSATKTKYESEDGSGEEPLSWIGIGDDTHPFNGTFLGGHRYIYRLYGKPLFAKLGPQAKVKQLQVQALSNGGWNLPVVTGGGLFAELNEGRISGCRVVGDVTLSGNASGYAGAFVGNNNAGVIYASYHVGETKGVGTTHVGGLVGNNGNGIISSCFQAGVVSGGTTNRGIAGENTGDNIYNTYFNKSLFNYDSPSSHVVPKTTAEMTKEQFVTDLNTGISVWRASHTGYDEYQYVHQPANYPTIKYVDKTATPSGGGSSGGDSSGN